jgi:sulfhydrogenase subunit beta (sulfur reductase)
MTAIGGVQPAGARVIDAGGLSALVTALQEAGYRTIGPTVGDGAIIWSDLASAQSLPRGWHDHQQPGSYRLERSGDEAVFAWAVGPQSLKAQVFPARATLWRAQPGGAQPGGAGHDRHQPGTPEPVAESGDERPLAVVGARPCELAGLNVLGGSLAGDPMYSRRRASMFVVVAECGSPSGTCFCLSMGTGPGVDSGFDLALTELLDGEGHRFLVRSGSARGSEIAAALPGRPVEKADEDERSGVLEGARSHMGRALDTDGLPALLARNIESPRWDEVADRCLACGNCTLVCPTCFCSTVEDVSDLSGTVERRRTWSSCFELAHSYMHGGPVRQSNRSRYRQWMTHKLSTWWDQFGTSGCVGCGRCITWCPVGIDITEEAARIRADEAKGA